jgi:hypothetical protein
MTHTHTVTASCRSACTGSRSLLVALQYALHDGIAGAYDMPSRRAPTPCRPPVIGHSAGGLIILGLVDLAADAAS